MNDIRVIEAIFAIGLSAISYFLKGIHADIRVISRRQQEHETALAVTRSTLEDLERRINKLETICHANFPANS